MHYCIYNYIYYCKHIHYIRGKYMKLRGHCMKVLCLDSALEQSLVLPGLFDGSARREVE